MNILVHAGIYFGSHLLARYGEQGLAHTLGVTTLRHGTNPLSWLSIHIMGFQPWMGDSKIGGDKGSSSTYKNGGKVYLAGDKDDYEPNYKETGLKLPGNLLMRVIPRVYAMLSTANLILFPLCLPTIGAATYPTDKPPQLWLKITTIFISILSLPLGLLMPTIKVRIDPEKIKDFKSEYSGIAYITDKPIYPNHIGIVGTLYNGLSTKVFSRIYNNPLRCITGIAMIALSAVGAFWAIATIPHLLVTYKISVIAGAIFAII